MLIKFLQIQNTVIIVVQECHRYVPSVIMLIPQDRNSVVIVVSFLTSNFCLVRYIFSKIYVTNKPLFDTCSNQYGQKNTIDIYPLTPFLATGEEILWQSLKADINDKDKKVILIEAVTSYRVFQYSYQEHKGAVILFPSVEDVKVSNEMRGSGLGEFNTISPYLSGIQLSGVTGITGDVFFTPGLTLDHFYSS